MMMYNRVYLCTQMSQSISVKLALIAGTVQFQITLFW